MTPSILFLCPHNAAKSVLAAALCVREAKARGVELSVESAGTEPDPAPAPAVVERLAIEGIDVSGHVPRRVRRADLDGAARVVSLGCDPADLGAGCPPLDDWGDVPAPSADLEGAVRAIRARVEALVAEVAGDVATW